MKRILRVNAGKSDAPVFERGAIPVSCQFKRAKLYNVDKLYLENFSR